MEAYWSWWGMALVLVILEMFSGTFYLLAVALGLSVAGGCAYFGMSWGVQVTVATLLCSGTLGGLHRWRKQNDPPNTQANFSYDIGQTIKIVHWQDERHARVNYRGAEWDAELAKLATPDALKVDWRIKEITGSRLIIQ